MAEEQQEQWMRMAEEHQEQQALKLGVGLLGFPA
jgi:hypothetical protein